MLQPYAGIELKADRKKIQEIANAQKSAIFFVLKTNLFETLKTISFQLSF